MLISQLEAQTQPVDQLELERFGWGIDGELARVLRLYAIPFVKMAEYPYLTVRFCGF